MMKCHSAFVFSHAILRYRFHAEHPFNQKRILLTKDLLEQMNVLTKREVVKPRVATENELALFHSKTYIGVVKRASNGNISAEEGKQFGLGTEDRPIFTDMHEASRLLVGGSLTAVDAFINGDYQHALYLSVVLHHWLHVYAVGICIF